MFCKISQGCRKGQSDEKRVCIIKVKQHQKTIVNIKWDTDGDEELFTSLLQEIDLPLQFASVAEDEDYLDEISDWLSDEYGYCNNGFSVQVR